MFENRIYLSPPHMNAEDRKLLEDAFDSNWIAPLGPYVDRFEDEISRYLNIDHAAALSSGTSALHLALKVLGIKQGDKVLCPSLTFSASANVILYEKAEPIFIDSSAYNWVIDLEACEKAMIKYKPKALISVDLYGESCDYDKLGYLCNKYNVFLIEDAAEALGSEYKKQKCGSFGSLSTLSFNGNKIITTSGGGMLLSNNEMHIKKAKFLSTQAREPYAHYEHKELGYNYRMSNLLAAIGCGQLAAIDNRVSSRRSIFKRYQKSLSNVEGLVFMEEADYSRSNRWLTTLIVDEKVAGISRTGIIKFLEKENIESRPVWKPMHLQPLYNKCKFISAKKGDVSAKLFHNGLCLPSGSNLSIKDQNRIIDLILSALKR